MTSLDLMEVFLQAVENDDVKKLENVRYALDEMARHWGGYTPLHVACAAGSLDCVKEIRKLKPWYAINKGEDGLTPLHIAAARGHVKIASALVETRSHLCLKMGPENKIPLHYAIENGNSGVMSALLLAKPDSINNTTSQKETALHLALKNDQFDLVNDLVRYVKQHNKEVINMKDNEGNTALHIAVAAKNFKVVKLMLDEHAKRYVVVDVNAHDNCGRTPLDCLGKDAGDNEIRKIRRILIEVGAKHGTVTHSSPVLGGESRADTRNAKHGTVTHSSPVLGGESRADIRNALLVVAGLIANTTYQSVLEPPRFKIEVDKTHTEGFRASYASYMTGLFGRDLAYIIFIIGNTFGFLVSVQMILCLIKDLNIRLPMLLSLTLMVQTYYCHTYYLPFETLENKFSLINAELLSVLPLMIPILLLLFQRELALALEFHLEKLSPFHRLRDIYHM